MVHDTQADRHRQSASVTLWYDGEIVPAEEATIPVSWIGPRLSTAVFDGIRAYWNDEKEELNVFRLKDHITRFTQALRFQQMECDWTAELLVQATLDVLRSNTFREDVYIAPTGFFGIDAARSGTPSLGQSVHIAITPRAWPSGLADTQPIDCAVSSWVRIADHQMPPRIKCIANYHNYRLATLDAQRQGCEGFFSAIMLNQRGKVAEGAMASLFMVRGRKVVTSAVTADILESITRDTVINLCSDLLELQVEQREIDRTELYFSEELFVCGTGSEIIPIASVDGYTVGEGTIGPITGKLLNHYEKVVRGNDNCYESWLTTV